jgi:pilus assembly protein Flp/PilA
MMAAKSAAFHLEEGIRLMLKHYIKASDLLQRLRTDKDGVVSFEYIIVAACIIGAVAAAFGTGAGGAIGTALTNGITAIVAVFNAAA